MTYSNCISLNDALYFDLFDEIPYRQVKQFFEKNVDRDEYDFEVEIEDLPCDRPAYGKVQFSFTLTVDINVNGSLSIMRPKQFTKILEYNTSSGYALKLIDLQEEEEGECCGKHCDETNNLKLAMGWNRYHLNEDEMITEQLFCEDCIEEYTTSKCKGCSETYKYTEMKYRNGGNFGEALYGHNDFYCIPCITQINSIVRD